MEVGDGEVKNRGIDRDKSRARDIKKVKKKTVIKAERYGKEFRGWKPRQRLKTTGEKRR